MNLTTQPKPKCHTEGELCLTHIAPQNNQNQGNKSFELKEK